MSDKDTITETDDDIEIVETDTIPAIIDQPEADEPVDPEEPAGDEDDEEEARLGDNEEDAQREGESAEDYKTRRNRARRQLSKQARLRGREELAYLRKHTSELERRLASLEGSNLSSTQSQIEQQIAQAAQEIQQAEFILAKAMEAQNGEDFAAALRLRDQAVDRRLKLTDNKQSIEQARTQQAQPKIDPRVVDYAQQWTAANPWYNPNGADEDSRITKAIDDGLVRDGYDPASIDYWSELTKRVNNRIGGETAPKSRRQTPPPQGTTREHAPAGTKNQVYVTPERKQAMIDAGVWDDVTRRNNMLKAYQEYDRENPAS